MLPVQQPEGHDPFVLSSDHVLGPSAYHLRQALELTGNGHLVPVPKHVGVFPFGIQFSVAREIPHGSPPDEALGCRDHGHAILGSGLEPASFGARFIGRQVLRAVAVPIGTIEVGECHLEDTGRSTRGQAAAFLVELAGRGSAVGQLDLEGKSFLRLLVQVHQMNLQRGLVRRRALLRGGLAVRV